MLVRRSLAIDAPPIMVWDLVSDPDRYGEFQVGVTLWDPRTKKRKGKGARFKVLMKIGSIEAGGVVRITEWHKPRLIEWEAEQGTDHRGRWEVTAADGGTELSLELEYHLVGPLSGLVERLAGRVIARNLEASLFAARRLVEQQPGATRSRKADDAPEGGPTTSASPADDIVLGERPPNGTSAESNPAAGGRSQLVRSFEMLNPRAIRTLRRAGLFRPIDVLLGTVAVAPWLVGRGPSLGIVSQRNAVAVPGKDAVRDRSGTVTWLQLDSRANRLVHVLEAHAVKPGDRVALLLRNGREFAEALIACQKVGFVAVPLNTWAKPSELKATLKGAEPRLLIHDALHEEQVQAAVPEDVPTLVVGTNRGAGRSRSMAYEDAMDSASAAPPLPYARDKGSARIVIHTSGTTGTPKGAARDAGVMGLREFVGLLDTVPLRRDDVILVPAPLFHSFGLLAFTLGALLGSTFVFPERFEPETTLALIEEHRATAAALVPVMINRILSLPAEVKARHDVSSLRVLLASGSAIPQDLRDEADHMFPEALYDLYGSTEAGWVAIATPEDMARKPGTVGRPVWGVEIAVFSPEGARLGVGETGEIHLKSGALFEGYTSGEQKSSREGFVSIGDLGHLDDEGYLYIEGRADDMVVVGGENVYPAEIEAVIRGVDGVDDVAVFGVPDPEYGQVLAAFIVGRASPDQVKAAARRELASFKVPRRVELVDELPRTSTGKVMKRELIPLLDKS
jgi:acyl-CoA synthetase (AMP-forming)/AMP-acid ligase II